MKTQLPIYAYFIAGIMLAAVICAYAIRKIIFIAQTRKIYDVPDDTRKIHGAQIPTLGGIGIFIGYIIIAAFFWPTAHFFMPFILASSVILFFTGIYDDIMNMKPSKKLIAQFIAAFITIYFAQIRIESFYGLFGINLLPYWPGVIFTTVCCTFFINVFNFIDGIDGLAGTLAVLYMGLLGIVFATTGHNAAAGISFALAGAIIGLLCYNIAPAKIYMGDTGSMFIGFTIFTFSILFLQDFCNTPPSYPGGLTVVIHGQQNALLLVISMLFLPVFDAIRVFILRMWRGISPLNADRTHLHYYLLDAGLTHTQSVLIIVATNILIITTTYLLQDIKAYLVLITMTVTASLVLLIVYILRQKNLRALVLKNNITK